jgi:glucokinase
MRYAVSLDIGGTKIHSIAVEWNKDFAKTKKIPRIIKSRRFPIQNNDDAHKFYQEIVDEISSMLEEFGKRDVARIGVGIAGPLTRKKYILDAPNLPLSNFPIRARLASKFNMPVYVDNDANCFTWAEHMFGAGRGSESTVGITLGTGVGGGLVFNHNGEPILWQGYHGSAGEVGHMILGNGESSFENLCSSKATYLWRNSDPQGAAQRAEEGDMEFVDAYKRFGFWLGVAIANLININNPQTVVIGGSIARSWHLFEEEMLKSVESYVVSAQAKKTKIVRAKLGDEAGALGAAYLI